MTLVGLLVLPEVVAVVAVVVEVAVVEPEKVQSDYKQHFAVGMG
ncbi:hypothetical protein ACKFKG_07845 [Phormidesmis sp. 146-35]